MSSDYYAILGIDRDAPPERVRQAYRAAVKECHPDASGTGSSAERFRAVEEAYETLRDRSRRQAYDRALEGRPIAAPRLRPRGGGGTWRSPWVDPFSGFDESRFVARIRDAFFFVASSAAEPVLEVLLSREEAAQGARVPVDLPIARRCPRCGGLGFWAFCDACGGTGRVRTALRVDLEIPAGVRDAAAFRCNLGAAGVEGSGFVVHVTVDGG